MASQRDSDVANALTLLAEVNLLSVHLLADLRNLTEDYFCAPANDLSETDSNSGNADDEEAEREVPAAAAAAAAKCDSEEEGESVDEVSVALKDVSTSYISEDAAKEANTVCKCRSSVSSMTATRVIAVTSQKV